MGSIHSDSFQGYRVSTLGVRLSAKPRTAPSARRTQHGRSALAGTRNSH